MTPLRRAISSTTDVTYVASLKLLSVPSRLEREPSKTARRSATPYWTSADAGRALWAATVAASSNPRAHRRITSRGTSADARSASCIAASRFERCTLLACGMLRAAKSLTAVSVSGRSEESGTLLEKALAKEDARGDGIRPPPFGEA